MTYTKHNCNICVSVIAVCLPAFYCRASPPESRHQRERTEQINRLIKVAEAGFGGTPDQSTADAVVQLGVMRATEAVPLLVSNFDFRPAGSPFQTKISSLSESCPCVYALSQIGGVSVDSVIKRLRLDSNGTEGSLLLTSIVLEESLGRDDAVVVLEGRIQKEKDLVTVARLRRVADLLKNR